MGRFTVTGRSFILWSISNQKVVGDLMTFIPLSHHGRILAVQPLLQLTGFTAVDDFPPSEAQNLLSLWKLVNREKASRLEPA